MLVEPFNLDNESDADFELDGLKKARESMTLDEITIYAQQCAKDEKIRAYFIAKAREAFKV